ncbi:unnamed protein product [Prorocentrum cordatum]|uniref:Uncharacterized protein n=1 Tax=Prorocentrum cordatum TaxID=2364126 RepID=A0ABN9RFL0_9DINO|nr:unnamed protein product [Polarella glacialis]
MSAVGAGMLTSVLPTAMVWPWLVDSCAIASAAGVRAVVPESVVYAPSSGAVVRLLMAGQQGAVAVEVGVDRGKTSEHLLTRSFLGCAWSAWTLTWASTAVCSAPSG